MRRVAAVVAAVVLLAGALAACDDAEPKAAKKRSASAYDGPALPAEVALTGKVTKPALSPVWLVRSTRTAESKDYDVRVQGVFVDGSVAVYYALDTILGVSTKDGKTLWKSPVDMRGETIELAQDRPTGNHRWSFIYSRTAKSGDSLKALDAAGDHLITVDTRTGKIVEDTDLDTFGYADSMTTTGKHVYLGTRDGLQEVNADGGLDVVMANVALRLGENADIRSLEPTADPDVVVLGISTTSVSVSRYLGVDVKARKLLWVKPTSRLSVKRKYTYLVSLTQGAGDLVNQRVPKPNGNTTMVIRVLDPRTGKVTHTSRQLQRGYYAKDHLLQIHEDDREPGNPYAVTRIGDDIVFEDYHGISRYDPVKNRFVWTTRVGKMKLRNADADYATFGVGPMSNDGKLIFTSLSSSNSGDVLALDAATGKVRGRWALDDRQEAGLTGKPLMALAGDQLLLARNRAIGGDPNLMDEKAKPLGPLNDLGWFTFPKA